MGGPAAAGSSTVAALLAAATQRLGASGLEAPVRDARLLLAAASARSLAQLIAYPEHVLDPAGKRAFAAMVERRAGREPVSRILGRRWFWGHEFQIGPAVLDPRPDSETLVEEALRRLPANAEGLVVDLGVGSGCLLLSVLAERPRLTGIGVDRSAGALAVASHNARALGLDARCSLIQGDWTAPLRDHLADCVLANPPYIPTLAIATLADDVRCFDPLEALDGGPDGLDAYRRLAPRLPHVLKPGGIVLIEIGADQTEPVTALLQQAGLTLEAPQCDLAGRHRCLIATAAAG